MHLALLQQAVLHRHVLVGPHALSEAAADQLTIQEVWDGIVSLSAEVLEDYPTDPRGPSCLIFSLINSSAEHVVVAYPCATAASTRGMPALAFMITCYRPGGRKYSSKWTADFKHRIP